MNQQTIHPLLPLPNLPLTIRPAVMSDLPFIDGLQKKHTKQVGWMPMQQLAGKIEAGQVLVAEENRVSGIGDRGKTNDQIAMPKKAPNSNAQSNWDLVHWDFVGHWPLVILPNHETQDPNPESVGYVIGHDQYFKRDDVGIVYQMNVVPGRQRGLVGARLLKALFERAAYGCRLFCCWCAQDIEANQFWEAMGFVPLAFRTGSRGRGKKGQPRTHIFWQRRINADDCVTPYWYPAQTSGGSIREDRLVFPIPPGRHWSEAMPAILPAVAAREDLGQIAGPIAERTRNKTIVKVETHVRIEVGGLRFTETKASSEPAKELAKNDASKRAHTESPARKLSVVKNDPQLVSAARELRDRWLERVNHDPHALSPAGRYEVGRTLSSRREDWRPVCLPAGAAKRSALPAAA